MDRDSEERGRLDLASYLYVAGGIPVMILFFIVLFSFANACDIPA